MLAAIQDVQLQQVVAHTVGNPSRAESLKLSTNALTLNDSLVKSLLNKYFLSSFNEHSQFHFHHIDDLQYNEVYNYAKTIFNNHKSFYPTSVQLAQLLYSKSTHVKVKEGEFYIALFDNVFFNNQSVQAIGLYKSESKESFLKAFTHGTSVEVAAEEGINVNKLDKGCLIINQAGDNGYIVLAEDAANKQNDTQYWMNDFLQIMPLANDYHHTNNHLSMVRKFIKNEYPNQFETTKADQIDLLNKTMDYFKTNEQYDEAAFATEVLHHAEVVNSFKVYKEKYEQAEQVNFEPTFDIHLAAVKQQNKVYKSILKLDKNFHIYIHGRRDLIEKGVDPISGKQYYKIFFDEEA